MNFLNYILIAFIAYIGIAVGLIIMRASKEEQKAGRKYFLVCQSAIIALMAISLVVFSYSKPSSWLMVLLIAALFFIKRYKSFNESYYIYPLLGLLFFFSLGILKLFLIEAVLIFSYGIVSASLLIDFKNKNAAGMTARIMLAHISFIIVSALSFLALS